MTEAVKAKLLIADDEPAQLRALCDTLQDQGYAVRGCPGGAQALAALHEEPFDLLLADLMMPGMSGIQLLRAALAIDPTLVGIIMTGEGTIGTAVEAMQTGALDYILKPFKLSAVLPVLGRALTLRRLRAENAALERRVREHAAELEATNRELEAFTRSASHDLRAPLNAVLGFSSLLQAELGPKVPDEPRSWMGQIEQAAQQMSDLIDALMRLSQVGKQALHVQKVNVTELVRGVVDELRQGQPQRRVTVRVGDLSEAMADPPLLRQVFVNLLGNAFKYTRDIAHAEIDVRVERQGGESVFAVRDNGPGFDMTRADRLFHAFQRLHTLDEFEGSGVGLSIVQRIVQRHGGRVWAHSAPGSGASFFFTL
ncbi:MAG TPA: ATP-binding protein [Burkholderiaceae bacterium]